MSTNNQPITLNLSDSIATLTLNRPEKHNALNPELINSFLEHLNQLSNSEAVRMVILRGTGKNFCAGVDLNHMLAMSQSDLNTNIEDAKQFIHLLDTWTHFPKPTITIVQGVAFGGALGLLAGSDITIGETNSTFCFSEVKFGLAPAMIAPYVIGAIGQRQAKRYMLSAEQFNASTAIMMGLLHEMLPHDHISDFLDSLCQSFISGSPKAQNATKQLIQSISENPGHSWGTETTELIARLRASNEAQTRLKTFFSKQ